MNRMNIGGALKKGEYFQQNTLDVTDLDIDDERVFLLVHDIKPPFLDGRIVFTK
jgi:hypothetical protein